MTDNLTRVNDLALALRGLPDIGSVVQYAAEYIAATLHVPIWGGFILEEHAKWLRLARAHLGDDTATSLADALALALQEPDFAALIRDAHEPVNIQDLRQIPFPAALRGIIQQYAIRSLLLLPFRISSRSIGVLAFGSTQTVREFSAHEMTLAQVLTNQLAIALDRADLVTLFQAVFEGVSEGILLITSDGDYTGANATAAEMLGYTRQEILRLNVRDVLAAPQAPQVTESQTRLARGESFSAEFDLRRKDGSTFPVQITGRRIRVDDRTMTVGIHRDMSSYRQIEAHLRQRATQLEALYLASLDLSSHLDMPYLLQAVAQRAAQLLASSAAAVTLYDEHAQVLEVKAIHNLPLPLQGVILQPGEGIMGQVFARGERLSIPDYDAFVHRYRTVPLGHGAAVAVPLRWQGATIGVLAVAHMYGRVFSADDEHLLDLFANYAAVAIAQARTFAQVEQTADELRRANQELRELDRMKDEFLATVTHELRRPLTNARLGVEHLLLESRRALTQQQRQMLTLVLKSIDEQKQVTDDLLYVTQLRRGKQYSLVCLDLREVVHEALANADLSLHAKEVALSASLPDTSVVVQGNAFHLGRALGNLLSNAIKFTPTGGQIQVTLTQNDQDAQLCVRDSGIGMRQEHLERIFEPFFQVDSSSTRGYEGLGLGLVAVREVVSQHGGQVYVTSVLGQGSVFTVCLPRTPDNDRIAAESSEGLQAV